MAGLPRVKARDTAIFNHQGNGTVLDSSEGSRYTVIGGSFASTSRARNNNNQW